MTQVENVITEDEVKKIISHTLENEDDTGWLTKIESGRNLYKSLLEPNELVISSIIAREELKQDFLCFIFDMKGADITETVIEYNNLTHIAKEKVRLHKEEIQRQFLLSIAG